MDDPNHQIMPILHSTPNKRLGLSNCPCTCLQHTSSQPHISQDLVRNRIFLFKYIFYQLTHIQYVLECKFSEMTRPFLAQEQFSWWGFTCLPPIINLSHPLPPAPMDQHGPNFCTHLSLVPQIEIFGIHSTLSNMQAQGNFEALKILLLWFGWFVFVDETFEILKSP